MLAGGGSFGAIQVGMMHALAKHGIVPDIVVGSSVGALNGAYFAGDPTLHGVLQLETIWRGLKRKDVFPVTWRTLLGFLWRGDFLVPQDGIRRLLDEHLPYRDLEEAKLPVHVVATDIVTGDSVVMSEGPAAEAIIASTAIPGAFTPVRYKDHFLADGAISSNTPIRIAVKKGATRLIILPTGHACAVDAPPIGAVANALHALTLLIARQLVNELEGLDPAIEYRCARWWAHPMISHERPTILRARSKAPRPGLQRTASATEAFPTSCGPTATSQPRRHCCGALRLHRSPHSGLIPHPTTVASKDEACHIRDRSTG